MLRAASSAPRFPTSFGTTILGAVTIAALGLLGVLIALAIAQAAFNQTSGPLALTAIFYPYLFIPALVLLPFALAPRARLLRLSLAGLVALYLAVPGIGRLPVAPAAAAAEGDVTFLSWNILATNQDTSVIRRRMLESNAAVIGIQELRIHQVNDFATDPAIGERYPHTILRPAAGYSGMGLLSAYPFEEEGSLADPPTVWARVHIEGQSVLVVNSHPFPGRLMTRRVAGVSLPAGFDPYGRDEAIAEVVDLIDRLRRPGEAVLLMGDFNVTEREPAYERLASGLVDVHLAVGYGPGTTWKTPVSAVWDLGLGLLRIDYQFASPELRPVRFVTDCAPSGSDHCAVTGAYRLAGR